MDDPRAIPRIPSLKTVDAFRAHLVTLGVELPCDDAIQIGLASPLARPVEQVTIHGRRIRNRWCVQPMEGWDGTPDGRPTEDTRRRWRRFGESGAGLICGGEAMAVRPEGRANPHQLLIGDATRPDLAELCQTVRAAHRERHGGTGDLVVGFQLTHSGRFCKPNRDAQPEPRVAFRHPLLDRKFAVTSDAQVLSDDEVSRLTGDFVTAARVAWEAGADFVDLKHCHGYLLHEFLGAHTRPGRYGGSFENRTRLLRDIVAGIRAAGNPIDIGVRLSAFDLIPFRPDPATSRPGKPGRGVPEEYGHCLPYRYGFGVNANNPLEPDLSETLRFAELCADLGVKVLNLSGGSPYYNPHLMRPALYPPSDGYLPPEDPLLGVARQLGTARVVRRHLAALAAANPALRVPVVVASALSYLQEYLPHVAQAAVREGWTDLVGLGRVVLSYPAVLADAVSTGVIETRTLCRTFSDCTTAPRNGLPSGCYPLDRHYAAKPEAQRLKEIKRGA